MADRMCCFGKCEKETVAVTVTVKGLPDERLVFCSLAHAALKLTAMEERKRAMASSVSLTARGTPERWEDRRVDETGPEYEARIGKLVTGTPLSSPNGNTP